MTADYINSHLSEVLVDDVAAEDWRRVAAAVDVVAAASKQYRAQHPGSYVCASPRPSGSASRALSGAS